VRQRLKDFLHGVWYGHPLHPAVVQVPIGLWTAAAVLDALSLVTRSKEMARAADVSVGTGLAAASVAVASGVTDWSETFGRPRKLGVAHALINAVSSSFYLLSLLARLLGRRKTGVALGFAGFATLSLGSYLGGELVFQTGQGVNRDAWLEGANEFTPVMPLDELPEDQPRKVEVEGQPVLLVRRGTRLFALGNICSHMGGPLDEGKLVDDCIECPWHGSRFNLYNGRVVQGPATFPQPRYETRVRQGQIEIRRLAGDAALGG
jgi:nitrite reductase/ring-hydroxylating ferredoxin subunit/uncharacterized membrane protein